MQLCTNCGNENPEGELFCNRCGVALGAISVATSQLGESGEDYAAGSAALSDEHVIFLHIGGFEEPMMLKVETELVLGRAGVHEAGNAGVNLEPYGASEHGVSRRHALLSREGSQLFLRDLDSTNHSFLNGEKLAAERDYALRDGDTISLGRLHLRVFFK